MDVKNAAVVCSARTGRVFDASADREDRSSDVSSPLLFTRSSLLCLDTDRVQRVFYSSSLGLRRAMHCSVLHPRSKKTTCGDSSLLPKSRHDLDMYQLTAGSFPLVPRGSIVPVHSLPPPPVQTTHLSQRFPVTWTPTRVPNAFFKRTNKPVEFCGSGFLPVLLRPAKSETPHVRSRSSRVDHSVPVLPRRIGPVPGELLGAVGTRKAFLNVHLPLSFVSLFLSLFISLSFSSHSLNNSLNNTARLALSASAWALAHSLSGRTCSHHARNMCLRIPMQASCGPVSVLKRKRVFGFVCLCCVCLSVLLCDILRCR